MARCTGAVALRRQLEAKRRPMRIVTGGALASGDWGVPMLLLLQPIPDLLMAGHAERGRVAIRAAAFEDDPLSPGGVRVLENMTGPALAGSHRSVQDAPVRDGGMTRHARRSV